LVITKKRCFFIVFLEVAVLSFVVWAVSTIIGFIIVLLININGIYLGSGTISYTLGGEYLFFDVKIIDIIKSFIIVMLFSLCATLAPGISICKRNIVDALSNR
jgi:ABC-type lipoprotein release transport system permease subunit